MLIRFVTYRNSVSIEEIRAYRQQTGLGLKQSMSNLQDNETVLEVSYDEGLTWSKMNTDVQIREKDPDNILLERESDFI